MGTQILDDLYEALDERSKWERLARGLLERMPRCDKGQCSHPATWHTPAHGSGMDVCDGCLKLFEDEPETHGNLRYEYGHAALVREAWAETGSKCRYCGEE